MGYFSKSKSACEFIEDFEINKVLEYGQQNKNNVGLIDEIINKAKEVRGLNFKEACVLLKCENEEKNFEIFELAKKIKDEVYGKRVVLFAPLYISNYCVNGCRYCPYCFGNDAIFRKKLTKDEIKEETAAIIDMGHKRIALEAGEDPVNCPIDYVLEAMDLIYSVKRKNQQIRRINVNIAATTCENYKKLKEAGIGTYVLFQETYNRKIYERLHPTGPKSDYCYHTEAMDRAMEGFIDDVGCGVLFGLGPYDYEFVGMLMHAKHLEEVFGVGPHTISVPRIKAASGIKVENFEYGIDDSTFLKLIACFRIAVPYVGLIISTREGEEIRRKALSLGISQISGGSLTSVGGYGKLKDVEKNSAQFEISDRRSLDEVVYWLLELGLIPSFCTSCYKIGRVGVNFMKYSKSCKIHNFCHPNALLTLKEYLSSYANLKTKILGEKLIEAELNNISDGFLKEQVKQQLNQIEIGENSKLV